MLKNYFSKNFANSFLTVFLPLFAIASIILFISMASITSYIEVDMSQMLFIYLYSLPELLFYTLPLAFVVALAVTINRLSLDYELIVLFSAGVTPFAVLKRFFLIAFALVLFLLTVSIVLIPQSKQIYESFKEDKIANAKLNIKPSELGQKFGTFFVYVAKEDTKGVFEDVVVFNLENDGEQIFVSKSAQLDNSKGETEFKLFNGSGYTYSQNQIDKIDYDAMTIFQSSIADEVEFVGFIKYWSNLFEDAEKLQDFKQFLYISLMPLLTVLAVASFTIIHPRYQSNRIFSGLVITIVTYLVLIDTLAKHLPIWTGLIILGLTQAALYFVFKQRVLKHF
jgi:lipopolysaccharide export system permease protein